MRNITIAQRIVFMIVTSVVALLLLGFVAVSIANKGTDSIHVINDDSMASIQTLSLAQKNFLEARANMYVYFVNTDDDKAGEIEKKLEFNAGEVARLLKNYEKLVSNDEDRKLLEADVANAKAFLDLFNAEVLPKLRTHTKIYNAREIMVGQIAPLGDKGVQGFNDHMAFKTKSAEQSIEQLLTASIRGKVSAFAVIALGVSIVSILGFFLYSKIKNSLRQIQSMVERVESDLDFTVRVNVTHQDEIGQTTSALNRLLDKLRDNLTSLATGARSVAHAANQLTATANDVATASSQQSEAASGMAATVEEMTVSINHVADRAVETRHLASESGALASSGEKVIGETASDIHEIASTVDSAARLIRDLEQHSQQISNVVSVIRDVADQTNLLALNAAIEAARAGEQGRGFAVVADEVRKLAERTSVSTKQISDTIQAVRDSASNAVASMQGVVDKVGKGVARAQEANDSMRQIGVGARGAVEMIGEIAEAIREQGAATNNIAAQVERIAQMSEKNSAAAEHSAHAAQGLDQLAADMQRIVNTYTL